MGGAWILAVLAAGCGVRSSLFEPDEWTVATEPAKDPPQLPPAPGEPARPPWLEPASPSEPDPEPEPEPEPCELGRCPDDGDVCNGVERCDPLTNTCLHAGPLRCDDGISCNGVEVCEPAVGCIPGEAIACTGNSRCDEATVSCTCDEPYLPPECVIKTAHYAQLGIVRQLLDDGRVLWVATSSGLFAVDYGGTPHEALDDAWAHFETVDGFDAGGGMALSPGGSKWFSASSAQPLFRLDDAQTPLDQGDDTWTLHTYERNLTPRALTVDASGAVWFGNYGETLVFTDAATPRNRADDAWSGLAELGAPSQLAQLSNVDALATASNGNVLLGSSSGGLFEYDAGRAAFAPVLADEALLRVQALALFEQTLWVARGFVADDGTTLLSIAPRGQRGPTYALLGGVTELDVDADGRVWLTSQEGNLACLEVSETGQQAEVYDATHEKWDNATTVLTRSSTDLWVGTDEGITHIAHDGTCQLGESDGEALWFEQLLRSAVRDVETEGHGVWFASDGGVDYLDTNGTPFDKADDRWAHFDESDVGGLTGLQGVVLREDGIKYFWGRRMVFALDDSQTPFDKSDDAWVAHETGTPLWVSGVVDSGGRLLVVARSAFDNQVSQPSIVVFEPAGTPRDVGDDVVVTITSGLSGMGRSMAVDTLGHIWLGTESSDAGGNLYFWDPKDTPLEGADDVWSPVRTRSERVWKLVADPTGGIWGTAGAGVFHFFDGGTPTDPGDDYWAFYPDLGSTMDIGEDGNGWFRVPEGAAILDVGNTPRNPGDDVQRSLAAPDALRFQSDLYTNGAVDGQGRFWIADERAQVFEGP